MFVEKNLVECVTDGIAGIPKGSIWVVLTAPEGTHNMFKICNFEGEEYSSSAESFKLIDKSQVINRLKKQIAKITATIKEIEG